MSNDLPYIPAIPVKRGCGTRKRGGVYIETGFAPPGFGMPLEHFLMCPPIPTTGLTIPARGVSLWTINGVTHIIDRVGMEGYPNVLDFVEEVRRFGLSRRVQANLDFAQLSPDSRIFIVHDRGIVENWKEYLQAPNCPKEIKHEGQFCIGYWKFDLVEVEDADEDTGMGLRRMPSFNYFGYERPAWVEPEYTQAIIGSFPISRLVVVKGDETTDANFQKAQAAKKLVVDLVDE